MDSVPAAYEREMETLRFHSIHKTHRHRINTRQSVMTEQVSQLRFQIIPASSEQGLNLLLFREIDHANEPETSKHVI